MQQRESEGLLLDDTIHSNIVTRYVVRRRSDICLKNGGKSAAKV
jgi:hypothetical protein